MAEGVSIRLFRNFLIAEGTYKITARRTQTGEDKIAVVINLATRVQQAFFDELSETIFNLIGGITREWPCRWAGSRLCAPRTIAPAISTAGGGLGGCQAWYAHKRTSPSTGTGLFLDVRAWSGILGGGIDNTKRTL